MACTKECATAIAAANNARRDWENAWLELKQKSEEELTRLRNLIFELEKQLEEERDMK